MWLPVMSLMWDPLSAAWTGFPASLLLPNSSAARVPLQLQLVIATLRLC